MIPLLEATFVVKIFRL